MDLSKDNPVLTAQESSVICIIAGFVFIIIAVAIWYYAEYRKNPERIEAHGLLGQPNYKPVELVAICRGDIPIRIVRVVLTKHGKDEEYTWVSARALGSDVEVYCNKSGNYLGDWKPGKVIQFPNGSIG